MVGGQWWRLIELSNCASNGKPKATEVARSARSNWPELAKYKRMRSNAKNDAELSKLFGEAVNGAPSLFKTVVVETDRENALPAAVYKTGKWKHIICFESMRVVVN